MKNSNPRPSLTNGQPQVGAPHPGMDEPQQPGSEPIVAVSVRPAQRTGRRLARYLSLDDFRKAARRRLPRMLFGFVDGAENSISVRLLLATILEVTMSASGGYRIVR